MTILLVDDSSLFRDRFIQAISEFNGIRIVGIAESANAALKAIHDTKPDVVVLDIKLKEGSGIDVLKSMRERAKRPIIIFLTNHSQEPYRTMCMDLGASHFFHKSSEFDKAMSLLWKMSLNSGAEREE